MPHNFIQEENIPEKIKKALPLIFNNILKNAIYTYEICNTCTLEIVKEYININNKIFYLFLNNKFERAYLNEPWYKESYYYKSTCEEIIIKNILE